jgi:sugar/nucleoside kinase (ribokinase family)
LRVAIIGKIGADEFGRFMQAQLLRKGIDTSGLVVDPHIKTGLSVILSRGSDRAILTFAGTISELRYEEIDFEILAQARHLHMGSYYMLTRLRPQAASLFQRAHEMGLTTSLDTNYDPEERWTDGLQEMLAQTDIFLPNQTELLAVTGQGTIAAALQSLSHPGLTVAVKLGQTGGEARLDDQAVTAPALKVRVVDTTGAGDTFDAGFIFGYLNGWELQRSLELACVCGSLSTRAAGGATSQPTLEEAAAYLS